jgi:hypothetical protein
MARVSRCGGWPSPSTQTWAEHPNVGCTFGIAGERTLKLAWRGQLLWVELVALLDFYATQARKLITTARRKL